MEVRIWEGFLEAASLLGHIVLGISQANAHQCQVLK